MLLSRCLRVGLLLTLLPVGFASARAVAQTEPPDDPHGDDAQGDDAQGDELGVSVAVERPLARTGGEDPTASATEINAQQRPAPLDTLADALLEAPGARALRSGGLGSPTTLSLRGSEANQVEVLFLDLPLTSADGSPFDLSTMPLWALGRVEVYRGAAPTWLARSGIGGLVRLVPRAPDRAPAFSALGGVGSFGLGHARVAQSATVGDVSWIAAGGVTTAEGNFPYVADVTLLDGRAGAVERARQNAWTTQGTGFAHLRARAGDGYVSALLLGRGRIGGVPGRASQPTRATERRESEAVFGVGYSLTESGRSAAEADWRVSASLGGAARSRSLRDPFAEIGLVPVRSDDLALRASVRLAAAGQVAQWLELIGVGLYAHETLLPSDALARVENQDSARDNGTFAIEARMHGSVDGVRVEVRPSARLSLVDSRSSDLRPGRSDLRTHAFTPSPTFRLGAAIEPTPGVTISASASTATRAPTQVELFGDRGFLVGVSTLSPERAQSVDVGLVAAGRDGDLRGQAEVRGFLTLTDDLIRYRRNALFQAIPENVGAATLAGVELGISGSLTRNFRLTAAGTLLGTWTTVAGHERRLPLRPWLTGYLRPEVRVFDLGPLSALSLYVDFIHVSEAFFDPANTAAIASRDRLGLGASASVWRQRVRLDVTVRDALDARGFDLLGFPLPGRSLTVSLSVRSD